MSILIEDVKVRLQKCERVNITMWSQKSKERVCQRRMVTLFNSKRQEGMKRAWGCRLEANGQIQIAYQSTLLFSLTCLHWFALHQ